MTQFFNRSSDSSVSWRPDARRASLMHWFLAALLIGLISLIHNQPVHAQELGVAAKKPILGAACANCPWGALADKVKEAMQPAYDVQICYNCSGADSTRIVSERRVPKPLTPEQIARDFAEPPNGPVDFGVVLKDFFVDAYNGTGFYKKEGPRKNLRLIARIEDPNYFLVATRASAFITDLKQIKEKHLPVRIIVDNREMGQDVLKYYGLTKAEVESWGGSINLAGVDASTADVIINFGSLNNTPESNLWYQATQKSDLRFLQLPDDLMTKMAHDYDWEIGYTPTQYMRGMTRPQKTLISSGTVVYGRDDLPEQFAYDVAKSLDQHKDIFIWSIIQFSYNPDTVWQVKGVPLHPGAERYYRERGYMK